MGGRGGGAKLNAADTEGGREKQFAVIPANMKAAGPSGAAFCTYSTPPFESSGLSAWFRTVMSLNGGCLKYLYGLSMTTTSVSIINTLYPSLMDLHRWRGLPLQDVMCATCMNGHFYQQQCAMHGVSRHNS